MVHTSEADQPPVPGATAVRVLGALLILLGGRGLYVLTNTMVQFVQPWIDQRWTDPSVLFAFVFLSGVLELLIIVAGVLLVRLDRAGRLFGLVVCSLALVVQVSDLRGTWAAYKFLTGPAVKYLTSSEAEWPGLLFWLLPPANIVLFLVGIVLISRWRPPRLAG
jgi:hypothetical protein